MSDQKKDRYFPFPLSLWLTVIFFYGAFEYAYSGNNDSIAIKYSRTIKSEDISAYMHILASDSFQGRETGEKGQKLAAAYISQKFSDFGIPPLSTTDTLSFYQKFPIMVQNPSGALIAVNGKKYKFIDDFYYFKGFEDVKIEKDNILFLGYGIESEKYNDYDQANVEGKILLFFSGEPLDKKGNSLITGSAVLSKWTTNRQLKRQIAQSKNAIAVMIISNNYESDINEMRHYIGKPSVKLIKNEENDTAANPNKLPCFYISPKMADDMLNLASHPVTAKNAGKKISKKHKPYQCLVNTKFLIDVNREKKVVSSENVLGYVEGKDKKDEVIIISAHYDHLGVQGADIYNGADDNGSGTSAVLELAQAFEKAKKDGYGPRRSILFMTVAGEEKGLLGSDYYTCNPVFPLEKTIADLNIDMIGRLDSIHAGNPDYVYIIGSDKLSSDLHNINEKSNALYTRLILDYTYNKEDEPNRFYYRSDHYNFAKNNIPVIFYFTGVHKDYHKPSDTVDKIDFQKMEKITKLIFFTAWTLANREDRIVVDTAPSESEK